jgi:tRNA G18 (ribose-2'-O)-methylase SpoU
MKWTHYETFQEVLTYIHEREYRLAAIEQAASSTLLPQYVTPGKVALLVGREVEGVEPEVLALCDDVLEIPMYGQKESFNVVQAAAMALYHCRFIS